MSLTAAIRRVFPPCGMLDSVLVASSTDRFGPSCRPRPGLAPLLHFGPSLMGYQSTYDTPDRDTNAFYRRTLHVLSDARIPFLVGGSHALLNYTGIVRETKDFDLFIRRAHLDE